MKQLNVSVSDESRTLDPDEFECYNLECGKVNYKPRIIKHTDLLRIEKGSSKYNWELGYQCRYCGMQQRQALSDRFTKTGKQYDKYVNQVADILIYHLDKVLKDVKDEYNANGKYVSLQSDRKYCVEILKWIMNIERCYKKDIATIWSKFPIVIKWLLQFHGFEKGVNEIINSWRDHKFGLNVFCGNSDDPKFDQDIEDLSNMSSLMLNLLDASIASDKCKIARERMDQQQYTQYNTRIRKAGQNIATAAFGLFNTLRQ